MNTKLKTFIEFLIAIALLSSPTFASAQFVPVNDAALSSLFTLFNGEFIAYAGAFGIYANNFNQKISTDPDSVRNIITGANLTEGVVGPCALAPTQGSELLHAYKFGPWASTTRPTARTVSSPSTI